MIMADEAKKKASLAIIMGGPQEDAMPEESAGDDLDVGLDAAVDELMFGIQENDPEAVKMALRSFIDMLS